MRRIGLVIVMLAVLLAAPVKGNAEQGGELRHLGTRQLTPRLEELLFRTPALAEDTRVRVLLPAGYDPSGNTRYPVLYLLHGASLDSAAWTNAGDAEAISAGYPLIVVMPDGGYFGYYADWWNFGLGGAPAWETYHLSQLLPWIDAHFPTVADRDGRAVAGLSMGGLGAMSYAARHPDLFTAAASFSGAIDTNFLLAPPIVEISTIAHGYHLPAAVFGPRLTDEVRWRGHNPLDLAENLRGLLLQLDTGNGQPDSAGAGLDPVEGAMYDMAVKVHERLTGLGIDHIWDAYGRGTHSWPFWQRDLRQFLPRLMERFAHPPPAPTPITYASIEPRYDVYGWHVGIARPVVEFSHLLGAGPHGFGLSGSGAAHVTTAAYFEPGQVVGVTVQGPAGTTQTDAVADGAGRLTVPVSLGPANPFQQLTLLGAAWALANGAPAGSSPSVTATVTFEP
jgi:S-formylglutathione hydrolase FrmB